MGAPRAVVSCLLPLALTFWMNAYAQPELVSVGLGGAPANGSSEPRLAISRNGRYVVFASRASNLVANDTNELTDVFVRDRATGVTTRVSVNSAGLQADGHSSEPALSRDGRFVAFSSLAKNLAEANGNSERNVFPHDRATGKTTLVSIATVGSYAPAISDDGRFVLFLSQVGIVPETRVVLRDTVTGVTSVLGFAHVGLYANRYTVGLSGDGRRAAFCYDGLPIVPEADPEIPGGLHVVDTLTGHTQVYAFRAYNATGCEDAFISGDGHVVGSALGGIYDLRHLDDGSNRRVEGVSAASGFVQSTNRLTDDGRFSVHARSLDVLTQQIEILDRRTGVNSSVLATRTGEALSHPAVSGDGSTTAFVSGTALLPLDTNDETDVYVLPLDADHDSMLDAWELAVGLDPTNGGDGAGDVDADGRTNAEEFAAGTLVNGDTSAYFAEGVIGPEVSTRFTAFNPSGVPVSISLEANTSDGERAGWAETLGPWARMGIEARHLGLADTAFATRVESSAPVVVERVVTWGVKAHAETAVPAPSTTWYFAEGATHSGFELFYLLFNPGLEPATTTIRWLRGSAQSPVSRTYVVPPGTRHTVWVNAEIDEVRGADVAAVIESDRPIVAERAMYLARLDGGFGAATASAGTVAPSTEWFLAEGATGPFFDAYILVGNPGDQDAPVTFTFLLNTGQVVVGSTVVPAMSRFTLDVENADQLLHIVSGDPLLLKDAAVSTKVQSTVPIVSERTMYWPGHFTRWFEAHNSFGVADTGTKWGLAEGRVGGDLGYETYILLANPNSQEAQVRVTYLPTSGSTIVRNITVGANSRFNEYANVVPGLVDEQFGVTVESTNGVPIAVERAMYWNALGQQWAAGTGALATKLR